MDERRHGSLSPSRVSLQSLSEAGARQLQKQTSRSLLAAETRTVAASSSARVRLAVRTTPANAPWNSAAAQPLWELSLSWAGPQRGGGRWANDRGPPPPLRPTYTQPG